MLRMVIHLEERRLFKKLWKDLRIWWRKVSTDDGDIDGSDDEQEKEEESDGAENQDIKIKKLQKELKNTQESHTKIVNEYTKCEKELRNKTEEVEILKVEVKDLKEMLKLQDELNINESKVKTIMLNMLREQVKETWMVI